jgi:uncharacterized protein involved in cysteine biosynthesis
LVLAEAEAEVVVLQDCPKIMLMKSQVLAGMVLKAVVAVELDTVPQLEAFQVVAAAMVYAYYIFGIILNG